MPTWSDAWDERARPDSTPFVITDRLRLTYGDLRDAVGRSASWLDSHGIADDEVVVGITGDSVELCRLSLSVLLAGYCFVPLDPSATTGELSSALERLKVGVIVADHEVIERIGDGHNARQVVPITSARGTSIADRLLRRRSADPPTDGYPAVLAAHEPIAPRDVDPEDVALVIFSSGSSGAPKGVQLSRRALTAHLETLRDVFDHNHSVIHNILPMHHADGLIQGPVLAYSVGGTLVRPADFTVGDLPVILDAIYAHKVTHMITVPAVLALLTRLGSAYADAFDNDAFQLIMSNAAPLPMALWEEIESRFGVLVCNSYGLTETVTSSLASGPDEDRHRRVGTVGRPVGAEVILLDPAGEEIREVVAEGEIGIRGDHLFSGYLGDPERTAAVFDGTTLRTGDIARRDADGYIQVIGRTSRMIITGGENVAPDEIDAVLLRHPSVLEAATVGVDDPVWGQRVVSAVTLAPEAIGNIDEAGLIAHCRESLSGPRVPRSIVVLPEIPRTGPSKVDANAVVAALTAVTLDGDDLEAAVRRLAGRVFGTDAETLDLHATPGDTEGWDSIAHMELVTLAEEAWEIELSNADVIGIDSLHDLVQCIRRHRE